MPYVKIPKDLSGVQAQLIFGLNKRQLIVAILALVVYLPLYFYSTISRRKRSCIN